MRQAALAVTFALLPGSAAACTACFGNAPGNKGLIDGFWWGIVLLLMVTMSMVGGIGWLLWKVERRRLAEESRG